MNNTETCLARLYRWAKGTVFFGDTAVAVSLWAGAFGAASGTLSIIGVARPHPIYWWEAYAPLGAALTAYIAGALTMFGVYLSAKSVKRMREEFDQRLKGLESKLQMPVYPEAVTVQYPNSPVIYRAKGHHLKALPENKRQSSNAAKNQKARM